jgi:hypothetical protein
MSYSNLVSALDDRFSPPDQVDLYRTQLRERKQRASESIPELGQHIRRLVNLAYLIVPADDGKWKRLLPKITSSRHQLFQICDCISNRHVQRILNEALRNATELQAFLKSEQTLGGSSSLIRAVEQDSSRTVTDELSTVNDTISKLTKSMSRITQELRELKERDRKQTTYHKSSWDANRRKEVWQERPHAERLSLYDCKTN